MNSILKNINRFIELSNSTFPDNIEQFPTKKEEFRFHVVNRCELLIDYEESGAIFLAMEKMFDVEGLTRIDYSTCKVVVNCNVLKTFLREEGRHYYHFGTNSIKRLHVDVEFDEFECMFSRKKLFEITSFTVKNEKITSVNSSTSRYQ